MDCTHGSHRAGGLESDMVAEAEFSAEPDAYPPDCVCVQALGTVREGDSLVVCDGVVTGGVEMHELCFGAAKGHSVGIRPLEGGQCCCL